MTTTGGLSSSTIGFKSGKGSGSTSTRSGSAENMDIDTPSTRDLLAPLAPLYETARKYRAATMPTLGGKRTVAAEMKGLQEDLEYTTKFNQKYLEMIVKLRRENIELEVDLALCKEDLDACRKEIRTLKAQTDWMEGLFKKP